MFESPVQIILAALLAGLVIGVVLTRDIQLGVALLMGGLYLPIALLNLPVAIVLWVPLTFLEAWPAARFVPFGVAILIGLAWLGTLGSASTLASDVMRRHRGVMLLFAVFLTWLAVSLLWATDAGDGAGEIWVWGVSAAVLVVITTTLSKREHLIAVCAAFVIAALIAIVIALPQLAPEGTQSDEAARLGGSLQNPNYLAAGLLSALVLAVGLVGVARTARWKWALVGAIVLTAFALLLTGSRGGLVGALTAGAAALVLTRGRRLQLTGVVVAVGVVGALLLAMTSQGTLDRVRTFDEGGTGRVDLWAVAWEMSEDHLVRGVGLNNFRVEAPEYLLEVGSLERSDLVIETPKIVHNAYLEFLAETGVVGLSLFLLLVVALMRATWLGSRQFDALGDHAMAGLVRAILIAQIGGLVALIFLSNAANDPLWVLLSLGPVTMTIAERSSRGARHD